MGEEGTHSGCVASLCQQMRFFPWVTRSFDTLQVELHSKIQDVQINFLIFNSVKSIHGLLNKGISD